MNETVSMAAIVGMVVSLIIAVVYPITLLVVWKIKQKPKFISAVIGAATFIIFALILEQIMHVVVMSAFGGGDMNTGAAKMSANIWLYGLYGGAAAAIFEEVGRLLAMKVCMKKFLDKKNAIMYGIGHGGIESIIILGLSEISNIATAITVNSGALDTILQAVPAEQRDLIYTQVSALWTTPSGTFYLAGVERLIAVSLHIGLSYLVYRFVKYNEKGSFIAALAIHFLVDFGSVVIGSVLPVIALEAILAVVVVLLIMYVVKKYKSETEESAAVA